MNDVQSFVSGQARAISQNSTCQRNGRILAIPRAFQPRRNELMVSASLNPERIPPRCFFDERQISPSLEIISPTDYKYK